MIKRVVSYYFVSIPLHVRACNRTYPNHQKSRRLSRKCLNASGNPPYEKITGFNANFGRALKYNDRRVLEHVCFSVVKTNLRSLNNFFYIGILFRRLFSVSKT